MIRVTSTAFESGAAIPQKYTCDGNNVNPSLKIESVPDKAHSLALIIDDPDSPAGTWDHWLVWSIEPKIGEIVENSIPKNAVNGTNSFGNLGYGGPCPGSGTHRYFFKVFALDTKMSISQGSRRAALEDAMAGHIIDQGELMGSYTRA